MPKFSQEKICFFVSEFGSPQSAEREISDKILFDVITPVCSYFGYKAVRADRDAYSPRLIKNLGEHLSNDELVIADISGNNPNVMYELGARVALQKAVILLRQKPSGERPFDLRGVGTVAYDADNLTELRESVRTIVEKWQDNPENFVVPFIPRTATIDLINNEKAILNFLNEHKRYANDYYLSMWCSRKYDQQTLKEYHEQEKRIIKTNARIRLVNTRTIRPKLIIDHIKLFKDDIINGKYSVYSTDFNDYEIVVFGQHMENQVSKEIAALIMPDDLINRVDLAIFSESKKFVGKFKKMFADLKHKGVQLSLKEDTSGSITDESVEVQTQEWINQNQ